MVHHVSSPALGLSSWSWGTSSSLPTKRGPRPAPHSEEKFPKEAKSSREVGEGETLANCQQGGTLRHNGSPASSRESKVCTHEGRSMRNSAVPKKGEGQANDFTEATANKQSKMAGCLLCPSHPTLHPSGHWEETGLEFGIKLPSASQIPVRPLSHLHPHQKEEARSLLIGLSTQLGTSCLEGALRSRPEVH